MILYKYAIVISNLKNFELFASNGSPLDISGYLDFSNFAQMKLDAQMRAENFQIINSKKNSRSEVYGRLLLTLWDVLMES